MLRLLPLLAALACPGADVAADFPDLRAVPPDLTVPPVESRAPAPGRRVRMTTEGWEHTAVYHAVYLPSDWRPGATFPMLVEYAGNGGYSSPFGDVSLGTVEGSSLGYGLTAGKGVIWICMPFVGRAGENEFNAAVWWGDADETVRYCIATVHDACRRLGGDPRRVILAGFSRGSIACNYIGLRDESIGALWRAFFCHSNYDGLKVNWPYPGADRASALVRLRRLGGRPQWISQEGSVSATQEYLQGTGVKGDFTFQALPIRNHSDQWVLRDTPARTAARAWLQRVLNAP
ncbi:MAG TPA: hypothetical protein VN775_11650 [Opitutaceae bacterium]|nr:hypothetical protein [Opitutaceae bacterium]